jgi:hypothetical protein
MATRFERATQNGDIDCDALHIATITREVSALFTAVSMELIIRQALILFAVATMRFKNPAVNKKFGGVSGS